MTIDDKDMINSILESVSRIDYIKPEDIPNIDLYMDQVTTFRQRASYPASGNLLWKAACIICKRKTRTSGTSIYSTCDAGNKPAAGKSVWNAFRILW